MDILASAIALRKHGFAIHWLHPKTKRPIGGDWSNKPVASASDLRKSYRDGNNVGVRLGEPSVVDGRYLHVIDLDIRDDSEADDAIEALKAVYPMYRRLPTVQSGSGGKSRHYYFLCDKPLRSKKLAHSKRKIVDSRGKFHWAWEIELFGTGKQVAIPPSIHPETGKPYRWLKEFDFDDLDFDAPTISYSRLREFAEVDDSPYEDDSDDLEDLLAIQPVGLTIAKARELIFKLPVEDWADDRDGWRTVGMALHHEFGGSAKAYDLWEEWSEQSEKFDQADQIRVWRSFKGRKRPVRMATIIATVKKLERDAEEERAALEKAQEWDDFDDAEEAEGADAFDWGDDDDRDDDELEGDEWIDRISERVNRNAHLPTDQRRWRANLELGSSKTVKPTLHNLKLILSNDPRIAGLPRMNSFSKMIVQRGAPGVLHGRAGRTLVQLDDKGIWEVKDRVNGDIWTDQKDAALRALLEAPERLGGYGIKVSDRDLKDAVNMVAEANAFHPVQEYLNSLEWDGKKRLRTVFDRYVGCGDNPYTRAVTRLTFLGAVTRIFEPGHKFDFVPIFEGLQGRRKSTFISTLARHWFVELSPKAFEDRKVMVESIHGSWIAEIPELSGFKRAEVNEVKASVSAQSDRVRLAYDRRANDYPRSTIFMGSTNESAYLRDETGNRRFWPLKVTVDSIDIDGLEEEIDQIWAEAVAEYRSMREKRPTGPLPLYITSAEAAAQAAEEQAARKIDTPDDMMFYELKNWLDTPVAKSAVWNPAAEMFDDQDEKKVIRDVISYRYVIQAFLKKDIASVPANTVWQITQALSKMPGWTKDKSNSRRTPVGQTPVYVRSDTTFEKARANGWGRPPNPFDEYDD